MASLSWLLHGARRSFIMVIVGRTSGHTQVSSGGYRSGTPTGVQIYPVFYIHGIEPVLMGEIDTITYSTHRGKVQIRPPGNVGARGIARGSRTVAGTLIFKIFDGLELKRILGDLYSSYYNRVLPDELPPFNIIVVIPRVDENGNFFYTDTAGDGANRSSGDPLIIGIMGVEIIDQSTSISIDDVETETLLSYVARDIVDVRQSGIMSQVNQGNIRSLFLLNNEHMRSTQPSENLTIPTDATISDSYDVNTTSETTSLPDYTVDDLIFGGYDSERGKYLYYMSYDDDYSEDRVPSSWDVEIVLNGIPEEATEVHFYTFIRLQ